MSVVTFLTFKTIPCMFLNVEITKIKMVDYAFILHEFNRIKMTTRNVGQCPT